MDERENVRTVRRLFACVFALRDGKIARLRQYHDSAAWVAAYQGWG
jgi:ketosteroid isomerase-like protein